MVNLGPDSMVICVYGSFTRGSMFVDFPDTWLECWQKLACGRKPTKVSGNRSSSFSEVRQSEEECEGRRVWSLGVVESAPASHEAHRRPWTRQNDTRDSSCSDFLGTSSKAVPSATGASAVCRALGGYRCRFVWALLTSKFLETFPCFFFYSQYFGSSKFGTISHVIEDGS